MGILQQGCWGGFCEKYDLMSIYDENDADMDYGFVSSNSMVFTWLLTFTCQAYLSFMFIYLYLSTMYNFYDNPIPQTP